MKALATTLLMSCVLMCSAMSARAASESVRFHKLIEKRWDYLMKEIPELATYTGYPGQNGRWADMSLEAIERRKKENLTYVKALESIRRARLSPEERLNLDLALYGARRDVEGQRFPSELMPVSQLEGTHQSFLNFITMMNAQTMAEYQEVLSRLKGIPKVLAQTQRLMEEGLKRKITMPKAALVGVPAQLDGLLEPDLNKTPFLEKFRGFPSSFSEVQRKQLSASAKSLMIDEVLPALKKFRSFFNDYYLPGARDTVGLSALPDGVAWYENLVKSSTTLSLKAREIHELGIREVKRIRAEMEKLKAQSGFEGDLKEFFEFLKTDSQFYFEKPEQLVAAYRETTKRIDPQLARLFGKLPRLTYGVLPIPAYKAKGSPVAYYEPGSHAVGRAGYIFVNTDNLKARPKWEIDATALHESVPGHHLQLALQQEQENVPRFRKFDMYVAYVEGWGLYAESLGKDLGVYQDVYAEFGRFSLEIWRAIRLVLDTGLHALNWTREKAVAYAEENSPLSRQGIEAEVDRFIAIPGQALAYKVGELKFKELKEATKEALGEKFDIRAFHDLVLKEGALPLPILEARVRESLLAPPTPKKKRFR